MSFDLMQTRREFGPFGGRFVPETLIGPLHELEAAFAAAFTDEGFRTELNVQLAEFSGRPTPLYRADRLAAAAGVAAVFLKREDLSHTGSHKINNALGQALLAKRMGKRRAATACARLGLPCTVYMGSVDIARQAPNVARMHLLGAEVVPVSAGAATLKEAISEALRDWAARPVDTFYMLGSALGPRPYPLIVRSFQAVIGTEARAQVLAADHRLPDAAIACVGGGSNAIGLFQAFLADSTVALVGVEAGGQGSEPGSHAARFAGGSPGVLHGCFTYLLQDGDGQVLETCSAAAGLDYPAVGPEHAMLFTTGRARYTTVGDTAAGKAFADLSRLEGIIPALESAHAVAFVLDRAAAEFGRDARLLVNLSGRGDKDLGVMAPAFSAEPAEGGDGRDAAN